MGWFFLKGRIFILTRKTIFVPEWGWVGSFSYRTGLEAYEIHFRPRLGMGWFADYVYIMCYLNLFSSPSGDGLVLEWYDRNKFVCEFSSPLGDGLVPPIVKHSEFVAQFSSPSGDGLVRKENENEKEYSSFRPRVGMGWFLSSQKAVSR